MEEVELYGAPGTNVLWRGHGGAQCDEATLLGQLVASRFASVLAWMRCQPGCTQTWNTMPPPPRHSRVVGRASRVRVHLTIFGARRLAPKALAAEAEHRVVKAASECLQPV